MEDKVVTISRAKGSLAFSANFQLIAAMNPCLCGFYGDTQKPCTCAHALVTKYQKRVSGPLLDRIDTAQPHRSPADNEKLSEDRVGELSKCIRARVRAARNIQQIVHMQCIEDLAGSDEIQSVQMAALPVCSPALLAHLSWRMVPGSAVECRKGVARYAAGRS